MRCLSILVAAALACAGGCKKKKEQEAPAPEAGAGAVADAGVSAEPITWVVPHVKVQLIAQEGEERDLPATELAQRVGERLRATPFFSRSAEAAGPGRHPVPASMLARITYGVIEEGSSGGPSTFVAVEGIVTPDVDDALPPRENVVTERPLEKHQKGKALDPIFREQVDRAVDAMIDGLVAREKLRQAEGPGLTQALAGDPDLAIWALQLIAERHLTELAPEVRGLLESKESAVADQALTTAVALGDREALGVITQDIDFQDYEHLQVVIEAAAAVGGEEARQFLEFVASGHADPDIKEHAKDALKRLERDPRRP